MAHQADHFTGLDVQIKITDHGAVAITKTQASHLDATLQLGDGHRLRGLGHVRHMVEDVKNAFGPGGGFLGDGHDAAHRVEPRIKPPDVGDEGRQHPDGNLPARHQPDTKRPDHQQAQFGQQRHSGREQRPDAVEFVVHFQVVLVGGFEAFGLAFFLRKRLDHTDAGDGVGQHVGDLAPDPVDLLEACAQPVAYAVDHPGNEGQWHQRDKRQPRVDGEQNHRCHDDHQHVGQEVQCV